MKKMKSVAIFLVLSFSMLVTALFVPIPTASAHTPARQIPTRSPNKYFCYQVFYQN